MFKYPENIIVNWLRSKMQGKIDLQEKEIESYEKNYFDTLKYLGKTSGLSYEILSSNSFSTDTTNATAAGQNISFEIVENGLDYTGKKLFIYSKFSTSDTNFTTFNLVRYNKNDNTSTPFTNFIAAKKTSSPSGLLGYYEFNESDFTDDEKTLAIRFYGNQANHIENEIVFSDIIIKIF